MFTVGSLFSGIGGIERGLEETGGFKTVWNCEIDQYASAVLRKHWPTVPNLGDITRVVWDEVEKPDVVCGGFPCQDVSQAGKGAGVRQGKNSGLWREYARCLRVLRPRYALIENVPALSFRGLDVVLADLAEMGFDAEWGIVSAQDVGAPHLRERMFIVAYPDCEGSGARPAGLRVDGEQPSENQERLGWNDAESSSQNVADPTRLGRERSGQARDGWAGLANYGAEIPYANESGFEGRVFNRQLPGKLAFRARCETEQGAWESDAGILRVAHGVPNRVHRIKCVGNAVVPIVAQVIGEQIIEWERER